LPDIVCLAIFFAVVGRYVSKLKRFAPEPHWGFGHRSCLQTRALALDMGHNFHTFISLPMPWTRMIWLNM